MQERKGMSCFHISRGQFHIWVTDIGMNLAFFLKLSLLRYSLSTIKFTLFSIQFCKFNKCIQSCSTTTIKINHISINPKNCCDNLRSIPPQLLATNDLFSISIVLPSPECHTHCIYSMQPFESGFFYLS